LPKGSPGRQRADSILKANGFEVDAFEWDQKFYTSKVSWVKIPKEIKDAGDMSVRQLHWLRKNGKI
jgi:hypothetical protein